MQNAHRSHHRGHAQSRSRGGRWNALAVLLLAMTAVVAASLAAEADVTTRPWSGPQTRVIWRNGAPQFEIDGIEMLPIFLSLSTENQSVADTIKEFLRLISRSY